jgi:SAM-dependent methyltransferase
MTSDAVWRARLYDRVHTGTEGDVSFYRRVCQGARHVLELGCGAGRVLLPIAGTGADTTGLDLDSAKLALLRERAGADGGGEVRLVTADMRNFDLSVRFDRVIIPYNGLYTLPSDAAMVSCLQRTRAHATSDARLYLDVYAVDPLMAERPRVAGPAFSHLVTVEGNGWVAHVHHRQEEMDVARSFRVRYRHEVHLDGGGEPRVLQDEIVHHYLREDDLRSVVEASGWRLDALWGDFQRSPFDAAESAHMVLRAIRD